jgi:hypothetical protein
VADYLRWETEEISEARIEAGYQFYRRSMVGDATFPLPRRVLTAATHGQSRPIPAAHVEALGTLAQSRSMSLASVFAYCAFVTAHRVYGAPVMRCLFSHDNRDRAALRRFPFMLANALYNQSRFVPERPFLEGLARFAQRHAGALAWGRLPPLVFFSMSRRLFRSATLHTFWLSRGLARAWAWLKRRPVSRLDVSFVDLLFNDAWYRLYQGLGRLLRRPTVRVSGLFINVTTALAYAEPPAPGPVEMDLIRRPQGVPESIPGNPVLELYRNADGVQVLFSAQYRPEVIRLFLGAYLAVVARVAEAPEVTLAELVEGVATLSDPTVRD